MLALVLFFFRCELAAMANVPISMQGVWIGSTQAGAGYTDVTRESSLSCVEGGGDILIPHISFHLSATNVTIAPISIGVFAQGSSRHYRRGTARESGQIINFENSILQWQSKQSGQFQYAFMELNPEIGTLKFVRLLGQAERVGMPPAEPSSYSDILRHRPFCEGTFSGENLAFTEFSVLKPASPSRAPASFTGPWTAQLIQSSFVRTSASSAEMPQWRCINGTSVSSANRVPTGSGAQIRLDGQQFAVSRQVTLAGTDDSVISPILPRQASFLEVSTEENILMLLENQGYEGETESAGVLCTVWKQARDGQQAAMAVVTASAAGQVSACQPSLQAILPDGWELATAKSDLPCSARSDGTFEFGVQVLHLDRSGTRPLAGTTLMGSSCLARWATTAATIFGTAGLFLCSTSMYA